MIFKARSFCHGIFAVAFALISGEGRADENGTNTLEGRQTELSGSFPYGVAKEGPRKMFWRWTAPGSGPVILRVGEESRARGGLRVTTGTVTNPAESFVLDMGVTVRRVSTFEALAGETYYFEFNQSWGTPLRLSLDLTNHPAILAHPTDSVVAPGGAVLLTIAAARSADAESSIQWQFNGQICQARTRRFWR